MNYSVATRLLLQPRPQGLLVFQYILFKSERVGYDDTHVACGQPHLGEFGKSFGGQATIQRHRVCERQIFSLNFLPS